LVEPLWAGVRVIGAVDGTSGALFEDGAEVDEFPEIVEALVAMVSRSADGAILDGYLTKQVTAEDAVGTLQVEDLTPSTGEFLTQAFIGKRRNRSKEAAERLETEDEARRFGPDDAVRLVATDLLWLDGSSLLDVPLLERRRLLEAVIAGEDLVRPGMYVRPPLESWIGSWRAQGFTGMTFKAANGRYHPGERVKDWATSPMPRR
jgi:hypothetical protein